MWVMDVLTLQFKTPTLGPGTASPHVCNLLNATLLPKKHVGLQKLAHLHKVREPE